MKFQAIQHRYQFQVISLDALLIIDFYKIDEVDTISRNFILK